MSLEAPARPERRLATDALRALLPTAALAAALAGWLAGWDAAVSALLGAGFVLVAFTGSALALQRAAGRGPGGTVGIMVGGLLARIALYALALVGLAQLPWIHRTSLALATAAAVAVTLAYELRTIARSPQLFWIDADAGRREAGGPATRSTVL